MGEMIQSTKICVIIYDILIKNVKVEQTDIESEPLKWECL
jgi:hypothetical protein